MDFTFGDYSKCVNKQNKHFSKGEKFMKKNLKRIATLLVVATVMVCGLTACGGNLAEWCIFSIDKRPRG